MNKSETLGKTGEEISAHLVSGVPASVLGLLELGGPGTQDLVPSPRHIHAFWD